MAQINNRDEKIKSVRIAILDDYQQVAFKSADWSKILACAAVAALFTGRIAGAALDVFEKEPLPPCHPFRLLNNVLSTPHIGYVTENTYKIFFEDTVKSIENWLAKTSEQDK